MMSDGKAVGVYVIAIILIVAWGGLMIWWLIWSILDLVNGNPATFWNIAGIVVPILSALGRSVAR